MKRLGGQQKGSVWLVLTESNQIVNTDHWVHNCGALIKGCLVKRIHPITKDIMGRGVPYCPKCEERPK